MTAIPDAHGNRWILAELDQPLCDPAVARVVIRANERGRNKHGTWQHGRFYAWARKDGRSEPGIALLFLLVWRDYCLHAAAEAGDGSHA